MHVFTGTSDSLSYKMLKGNIENLIGLAKVPIGNHLHVMLC